jgi:hypothetical protein
VDEGGLCRIPVPSLSVRKVCFAVVG